MFDGLPENVVRGNAFYRQHANTGSRAVRPRFLGDFVTVDNINELVLKAGFSGEIDVFSLDMGTFNHARFWQSFARFCYQT
jgi:hypothetical protein